ncbi:MAG TPA: carboxypeptidase-like regulatory domain-containing protein [Gemmatimonadales bacterium]|nr:carboxypeptidase-like regulatory domain-containing protein [Gemmatimonadales bacterium]
MRGRLALVALICGLALGACNDASQSPTEAGPGLDKGVPCPTTVFPLDDANALIIALYPTGPTKKTNLQADRLAVAHDISEKWSKCKVADPQSKVVAFVNQLLNDFRSGILNGGTTQAVADQVSDLINVMYSGVGFGEPDLPVDPTTGVHFGVGFFTPGTQLLVQTDVKDGAVLIPRDAFTETTAITILLRPDTPNPFDGSGFVVYPPFYEITASNLSGTHYLANGQAVVGFCVDEWTLAPLSAPAIAHLAVAEGAHPGGFEILDDASDPQYDALGLDCPRFIPPSPIDVGSIFDHGFKGFALAAPRAAARAVRSAAAAIFLPREAYAFGKVGLGSLASSLSPFGVTDRDAGSATQIQFSPTGDPGGQSFSSGISMDWPCGTELLSQCVPLVTVEDASNAGVGGVSVTASLVPVTGVGTLDPASTTVVVSNSDTGSGFAIGEAAFDNLIINLTTAGTFKLHFSAPGGLSLDSGEFQVDFPIE